MAKQVDAIYEGGVLRPLEPLGLCDQERVRLTISPAAGEAWMDLEFMDSCREGSDPSTSLQEVRAALSRIRGSMDDAIGEVRGDY